MNSNATDRPPRLILLGAESTAGASADVYLKRHPSPTTARQEFDERKSAQHWFTKSLNLVQSARVLWTTGCDEDSDPSLLGVALMLNAMSLELAAKGVLIGHASDPVSDEDLRKVVAYGHRLSELLLAIGASLMPADEDALRALEEYLTWAGRYPLPRKVADYEKSEAEHGMPPGTVWDQVESLRARLAQMFEAPDPADRVTGLPSIFLGR